MCEFQKENFVQDEDETENTSQSDQLEPLERQFSDAEPDSEVTETDTEPEFSLDESLLPDQLICENELIAEEVLPQSIVIDGLIAGLEAVENDLQISDGNDSIFVEQEFSTEDIFDSLGDKDTIALDFEKPYEQESFDSTETSSSGDTQVQQLLFEPVQEQEESEQVADDQAISDTAQHVEQEEGEENSQPISDGEWAEQEQANLEILESTPDIRAQISEVIGENSITQDKFDQLVRDYQLSLDQRAALDEDSSSEDQEEADLNQQMTVTSDNLAQDSNLDVTQQEGVNVNTLSSKSESPHTSESLLSENDFPPYFSSQEILTTQLSSELCLMEDSLESNTPSVVFQDREPEFSSIERYLSTIDSPRLLDQFHTQMQEETTQLLLPGDSQVLPELVDSLELVSTGPTIPEAPPYNFLQDLEDQEEANQHVSLTHPSLLQSFEQAQLKQELVNYQFVLRNLPAGTEQLQPSVQKADRQNSPSSEGKTNHKAPGSRTGVLRKPATVNQFLIPQTLTEIQGTVITFERGFWGHLALHIPLLGRAGTDTFLDSLITDRQQEHQLANAIVDKSWSTVRRLMLQYSNQKNVVLDPQIMDKILNWSKNELSIKPERDRSYQEGSRWVIIHNSTKQDPVNLATEINFKPTGWNGERFNDIKTISKGRVDPQIKYNEWVFRRYDRWIQRIHNPEFLEKRYDRLLLPTPLITEYDNVKDPLFKMCNNIFSNKKESHKRQYVNQKLNNVDTKTTDLHYKDLLPYKQIDTYIQLKSHWDSNESTGFLKTHVRVDLLDKLRLKIASEKDIQELIGQERILEAIVSLNSDYRQGDSIFMREQVRTENLTEIPENASNQFGKPDSSEFRQPDFLILGYKRHEYPKINQTLMEIKLSKTEFKTNSDGYGRGQPFRDGRWHLHMLLSSYNEHFPDIKEEDIEVSYYILTAEITNDDAIMIKGEELIRDVPAPYVYPNTGIILKNDKDVYELIKHIRNSVMVDFEDPEND